LPVQASWPSFFCECNLSLTKRHCPVGTGRSIRRWRELCKAAAHMVQLWLLRAFAGSSPPAPLCASSL
jgi:hypothetical protein